jgi:hypothetical protein
MALSSKPALRIASACSALVMSRSDVGRDVAELPRVESRSVHCRNFGFLIDLGHAYLVFRRQLRGPGVPPSQARGSRWTRETRVFPRVSLRAAATDDRPSSFKMHQYAELSGET